MSLDNFNGADPHGRPFTGRMLLGWLLGTFAVVMAVNIGMVLIATTSQTGLVTDKPFEHGLMHNDILAEAARQQALGWAVEAKVRQSAERGRGAVTVTAANRDGTFVTADVVTARLLRPADAGLDRSLEVRADGARWVAPFDGVPAGLWELEVTVSKGGDVFTLVKQVVLP